jgi:hypothetical protein
MDKREQNERKFDDWVELPGGGRRYRLTIEGRHGWKANYVKEVDAAEVTLAFWQEIYNERNELVEVHHKYPHDTGHQKA